jgi:pimeloyl-ACP methyl ester carboxylesterase
VGEKRPWAIVAHSMGALVARSYVEDPTSAVDEFATLILVAPVNQGSSLAKAQTFLQLLNGVQAVQSKKTTEALAHLGDGLGEAAQDLTPGSSFLTELNRRPRRKGVSYHILAGNAGIVSTEARRSLEQQIDVMRREGGLLGGLTRFATADLAARLDEVSDGYGDGCVSVARSRIDGVTDHVVIHANHAELIRAPLLFKDPGPVACMPYLLRWLNENRSRTNAATQGR